MLKCFYMTNAGKWLAGILLISFTVIPCIIIIAYWPDRFPGPKENVKPLYFREAFNVRLACIPESVCCLVKVKDSAGRQGKWKVIEQTADTIDLTLMPSDSTHEILRRRNASLVNADSTESRNIQRMLDGMQGYELINLSTLLLLLVAAAGFVGNMIHIATSFTTFLGAEQLKSSWFLWYFVRPFTASALAVGVYFVFRGGFLSMSESEVNINLYGVVTIAILTGLFTDRATQKLKDVFDAVFSPKSDRPNPLELDIPKLDSVTPLVLEPGKEVNLLVSGTNLTGVKYTIKINDSEIGGAVVGPNSISFKYTVDKMAKATDKYQLIITDKKDQIVFLSPLSILTPDVDEIGSNTSTETGNNADAIAEDDAGAPKTSEQSAVKG